MAQQILFLEIVTLTFDLLTQKSTGFLPFPISSIYISSVSMEQGILKLSSGNDIRNDGKANSTVPRLRERRGTKRQSALLVSAKRLSPRKLGCPITVFLCVEKSVLLVKNFKKTQQITQLDIYMYTKLYKSRGI